MRRGPRSFDPNRVGALECRAWATYYQHKWGELLVTSVALVRAGFGMDWWRTLRGAWFVLRANQVWAPYPDNDPGAARRYMERFYTGPNPEITWAQKANQWAGQNYGKWKSDEFDKLYDQAKVETDTQKAATLWQQANDVVVNNYFSVPLVDRKFSDGKAKSLKGPDPGPFDCVFAWNVADWTRG